MNYPHKERIKDVLFRAVSVIVVTVIAIFQSVSVLAEDPSEDLLACTHINDQLERLACYDKNAININKEKNRQDTVSRTDKQRNKENPSSNGLMSNQQSAAQRVHGEKLIPADMTQDRKQQPLDSFGKTKTKEEQISTISSEIVKVERTPSGRQIISLVNGQVWMENERGKRKIPSGRTVEIVKGRWDFKMKLSNHPDIAVHRIDHK